MVEFSRTHFVRVGVLGHVGRFVSVDAISHARGTRVVCRTKRGLEIGQVLSAGRGSNNLANCDGSLLRRLTPEDELLVQRLERNRHSAYEACVRLLKEQGVSTLLMDVEHLFDGRSLYFYFLGPVPAEVEKLTGQLAEAYETRAQFRTFSEAVESGCGPGCGTDESAGCGDACSSCAISDVCQTRGVD